MNQYEKVAQWILDECDNPIDEIAWLLKNLYDSTAKKPQFSFHEAYGDVVLIGERIKERKENG
tara:strand:+ start:52 stop:240 length:189 start_codon:yes stop_codon:yes gene_type:complete